MSGRDYPRRSLSSDNYRTDTWILEMFEGWFDPCPLVPDWLIDGLNIPWPHRTFVNPPYSNPLPWVHKAIAVNEEDGHTIALLLKHDSSTEWYRLLHEVGAHFLLVNGRLKHQTGKGAAFPSVIVILEGYHNAIDD
jgi:hypothetical protein